MEYRVEDLSPVKKKVVITTEPQEVDAAIMGTVAVYKTSVRIDGFRKGKVPASLVEQRLHDKIYAEAQQDLINVHINDIMQKLGVVPLGKVTIDADDAFERSKNYTYSIEFEVLPSFQLPPYEGMEVEQEKVVVDEQDEQRLLDHILRSHAKIVPVEGNAPARDGQIANIGFAAYEDGKLLEDFKVENFNLALGEHQALEAFENLVKTIPNGGEGEGEITFPQDFITEALAGKTVLMKIKVYAVKEYKLPELTDAFAKTLGKESVAALRSTIHDSCAKTLFDLHKSAAQKKLLDRMLKMVDYELPTSMVETAMNSLLVDQAARLERQGRSLAALGKNIEEIRDAVRSKAEAMARSQVLLLSIAKKEGLDVSETEVSSELYRMCLANGDDFKKVRERSERNGYMFVLRDRLLADKAMDLVYAKAKVTEVESQPQKSDGEDTAVQGAPTDADSE